MWNWLPVVKRRKGWLAGNLNIKKVFTLIDGVVKYSLSCKRLLSVPATLKIDISPLCNLNCIFCIHARIKDDEFLEKQCFDSSQKMTINQYRNIIDQVKGKSVGVSLYYYGDPFMHPDIDLMCRIANDAGLQVHINSNFSYNFSLERIQNIVTSGITHLTICVDGLSQETYETTRRGGRIDYVLSNLKRLCQYKHKHNLRYPIIEIQYLKYQHNIHELPAALTLFKDLGVDHVEAFWGQLNNVVDKALGSYETCHAKDKKIFPQCLWPWFGMVIKYNGDVIPCCEHRSESQYIPQSNILPLGNVFQSSIFEIWNSEQYRQLRQVTADPTQFHTNNPMVDVFCHGCYRVFHTDLTRIHNMDGKNCSFDELYAIENNYIIRKDRLNKNANK